MNNFLNLRLYDDQLLQFVNLKMVMLLVLNFLNFFQFSQLRWWWCDHWKSLWFLEMGRLLLINHIIWFCFNNVENQWLVEKFFKPRSSSFFIRESESATFIRVYRSIFSHFINRQNSSWLSVFISKIALKLPIPIGQIFGWYHRSLRLLLLLRWVLRCQLEVWRSSSSIPRLLLQFLNEIVIRVIHVSHLSSVHLYSS